MVDIECEKCGYEWDYTGELMTTTCPRCNLKTPTPLDEEVESNADESIREREVRAQERTADALERIASVLERVE
ncbi:hypothetical protein [Natrinema salinisoli]|uniref:hypothetical protein n=1 Tax=Natrinema salinisoli TaxID=2878535 RepID=UPI001CF01AFF|nr:hypothetical protein [Natrinema salinisoli]